MIASMDPTNVSAAHERNDEPQSLRCSFCGKGHDDVRKMIASPTACICDECVKLCAELIAQGSDQTTPPIDPPR
jgi:ATP-dependent Clp protease ATP-binding subunit ClpX